MTSAAALPPPPPGKTGFPWDSAPAFPTRAPGRPWPRLTLATPSYNQAEYLEETIRSVLVQRYPNLEYIIVDGGSRDGSVEIIRKYHPWLAHWESETDRGQVHAINKALRRATGLFFTWINSDDLLAPGALLRAGRAAADLSVSVWVLQGSGDTLSR